MIHVRIPTIIPDDNQKRKSKEDWMAEIEEILEEGESCVRFIADLVSISPRMIERYIRELRKMKVVEKTGYIKLADGKYAMYALAPERPRQQPLINEPVARDWLVAAFFGEYKPC